MGGGGAGGKAGTEGGGKEREFPVVPGESNETLDAKRVLSEDCRGGFWFHDRSPPTGNREDSHECEMGRKKGSSGFQILGAGAAISSR